MAKLVGHCGPFLFIKKNCLAVVVVVVKKKKNVNFVNAILLIC